MQHNARRIVICNTAERKAYIALLSMRETQYDEISIILVVRDYSEQGGCEEFYASSTPPFALRQEVSCSISSDRRADAMLCLMLSGVALDCFSRSDDVAGTL